MGAKCGCLRGGPVPKDDPLTDNGEKSASGNTSGSTGQKATSTGQPKPVESGGSQSSSAVPKTDVDETVMDERLPSKGPSDAKPALSPDMSTQSGGHTSNYFRDLDASPSNLPESELGALPESEAVDVSAEAAMRDITELGSRHTPPAKNASPKHDDHAKSPASPSQLQLTLDEDALDRILLKPPPKEDNDDPLLQDPNGGKEDEKKVEAEDLDFASNALRDSLSQSWTEERQRTARGRRTPSGSVRSVPTGFGAGGSRGPPSHSGMSQSGWSTASSLRQENSLLHEQLAEMQKENLKLARLLMADGKNNNMEDSPEDDEDRPRKVRPPRNPGHLSDRAHYSARKRRRSRGRHRPESARFADEQQLPEPQMTSVEPPEDVQSSEEESPARKNHSKHHQDVSTMNKAEEVRVEKVERPLSPHPPAASPPKSKQKKNKPWKNPPLRSHPEVESESSSFSELENKQSKQCGTAPARMRHWRMCG